MLGNPISIPTRRKISAVANPGNHPEYIAAFPMISIDATEAKAVHSTHRTSIPADIPVKMPQVSPTTTPPSICVPSAMRSTFSFLYWKP